MVTPSAGAVILVRFPFSDLSQSKLRPAVVLVHADRGDWILCQITSKPYGDVRAVQITDADFANGGLRLVSYARPAKLFTAHQSLFSAQAGKLKAEAFARVRQAVHALFK